MNAEQTQAPRPRDATVFISYARADNEKPPDDDTADGWVRFFWRNLCWELNNEGATQAKLWLDLNEIERGEAFTPTIEAALREAKLLIAIFSRNWAQSSWCRREVDTFARIHEDASGRIVPIFKGELPSEELPAVLQGEQAREGYRFFERDESGVRYFYWRGLEDRKAYFSLMLKIARFVMGRLHLKTPPTRTEPGATGPTIFLAAAARELRDARQRLLNDLTSAGAVVVPAIDDLPDTALDYERVMRQALSRAELAVHLLGEDRGITPSEGTERIIPLQLRLSREVAAARSLPRLLWVPRWLPGRADQSRADQSRADQKRDPYEVIGRYGGLQPGEEIYGEEVTDFSQWLRRRLRPAKALAPLPAALIVASANEHDDELVADLANLLQGLGRRVGAIFAGQAMPETAGAVNALIPWGQASGPALEALLARIPPGARIVCLRLPAGDEKAKRTFFQQKVHLERVDALPADRQEARQLLERLEVALPPTAAG